MTRFEARLARVEKAIDTNTAVFVDGIKMLEIQQSVAFRILQDVFNGAVRIKGMVSSDDGLSRAEVDIEGYIKERLEELMRVEEAPPAETTSLISHPDEERPIIFGGDLG